MKVHELLMELRKHHPDAGVIVNAVPPRNPLACNAVYVFLDEWLTAPAIIH